MRPLVRLVVIGLGTCLLAGSCVEPFEVAQRTTADVVVVEGTIIDLAEPHFIQLSRSRSDPASGIPYTVPLTEAKVQVVVDSSQVIAAQETPGGYYQLPNDFKGQVGHAYQLRFTLSDGRSYASDQQVLPAAPPIGKIRAQFNPSSLAGNRYGGLRAAHDVYIDTQDPAGGPNYYRWDWRQWEKQDICRSCFRGQYSINNVRVLTRPNGVEYFETDDSLLEDCFYLPATSLFSTQVRDWVYDYQCRSQCWAILGSTQLNVFADSYTNGGLIAGRRVAQIPFYQRLPCLVEIRQSALTPTAYQFYKQLQDQTQNAGGVADAPPTASVGNVQNLADRRELVVGFFTASGVATSRYFIDRKDAVGPAPGLFFALNGRDPIPEPSYPYQPIIPITTTIASKPPYLAVCSPNGSQTPYKPLGWRD